MYIYGLIISLTLLVSQVFAATVAAPPQQGGQVKSYREWKNEKVQTSTTQSQSTRNQIIRARSEGNLSLVELLERQQNQQQWNLEIAKDLSVADYFVLYLSQQPQQDRFRQVAQKLTPAEVVELMEAYAGALAPAPSAAIPSGDKLPTQATQIGDQIK